MMRGVQYPTGHSLGMSLYFYAYELLTLANGISLWHWQGRAPYCGDFQGPLALASCSQPLLMGINCIAGATSW